MKIETKFDIGQEVWAIQQNNEYVRAKCGKYANAYSEYKCLKRDVAIYKRAFELAKLDGLEMDGYIVEAKKELEEEDAED